MVCNDFSGKFLIVFGITLIIEFFGLYLVIRDSRRKSGKWRVNINPKVWRNDPSKIFASVSCARCRLDLPVVTAVKPPNQLLFGGWGCEYCGEKLINGEARFSRNLS